MFSVIIATYNRVALLTKTLESLFRQEYAEFEIVVANDGSTDGTHAYLERLAAEGRIIYTHHANSGLAATRKAALDRTRGEFIAITDNDCVVPADWLKRLARHFEDPQVAGVGGATETGNPESVYALTNDLINNYFKGVLNGRPGIPPYVTGNNVAYRRSALEKAGGPDLRFQFGAEDRDLSYRVERYAGRVVYDPTIVIGHFNDTDFSGFVRQQYHQGRGSRLYYALSGEGGSRPSTIPASAYLGLLLFPFRQFSIGKAAWISFLIVLGQAATVVGFAAALAAPAPGPKK